MKESLRQLISPRNIALLLIGAALLVAAVFFSKNIADTFKALFGKAAAEERIIGIGSLSHQPSWTEQALTDSQGNLIGFNGTKEYSEQLVLDIPAASPPPVPEVPGPGL
jgi:hypothetical protein